MGMMIVRAVTLAAVALGAAAARPESASPAPTPAGSGSLKLAPATAGKEGFSLQSESGDYKLRLSGYAQADGRFYLQDRAGAATDTFLLRRVRPIVQGTASRYFDFYINPDFGDGKVTLYDAYVDLRRSAHFKVRFGKFKPAFGLERLQSGAALMFVERALPTSLVPNRDVGIQLHGDIAGGIASYALGIFNGAADGVNGDGDTNDAKDLVGRLQLKPFKNAHAALLSGFGLAIAGSTGRQAGALPSFKSPGQQAAFAYDRTAVADGSRRRFSAQGFVYAGRFGAFGEYVSSRQRVTRDVSSAVTNTAWQAAGSIVLTGEAASPGGVKPRQPFDPAKKTWGAVELAGRVNGLELDQRVFDLKLADAATSVRRFRGWAVGLNWYLTQNFKYVVNYERTAYRGGAKSGDRPTESVLFLRAQISY